jgi:hypothetical protein
MFLATITINYSARADDETGSDSFDRQFVACFQSLSARNIPLGTAPAFLQNTIVAERDRIFLEAYINNATGYTNLQRSIILNFFLGFWGFYSYCAQYYGKYELWESKGAKNSPPTYLPNGTLSGGYPVVSPFVSSLSVTSTILRLIKSSLTKILCL